RASRVGELRNRTTSAGRRCPPAPIALIPDVSKQGLPDRDRRDRMADHAHVEYATAEGNDLPAHEAMYDRFVHLVVGGGALVTNIVLGLAIGAVESHWLIAFAILLVSPIVAGIGLATGGRMPSAVMVLISIIALGLCSGGGSAT